MKGENQLVGLALVVPRRYTNGVLAALAIDVDSLRARRQRGRLSAPS